MRISGSLPAPLSALAASWPAARRAIAWYAAAIA
jgi:hypothetical protein